MSACGWLMGLLCSRAPPAPFWPARLFDADGDLIDLPAQVADTDTGEVVSFARDREGSFFLDAQGGVAKGVSWHKPPLTVAPACPGCAEADEPNVVEGRA